MLTVRPAGRLAAAVVALLILPVFGPVSADAADDSWTDQTWSPTDGGAEVEVSAGNSTVRPGSTGTGGGGGCPGAPGGACTDAAGNWWHAGFGCYLQPAPSTAEEAAAHPGETPWRCATAGDGASVVHWLTAAAAGPDPAVLAQRAVDSMRLAAPRVGATPLPGPAAVSLVGLPTWLWIDGAGPSSMGPLTASATAGPVTVTATARVASVDWDLGDGTTVTCTGPGTPWTPAAGASDSPDCGHRYTGPGERTITATTRWTVDWSGGGSSGTIAVDLSGTRTIDVQERRAVIVG